jgi:hypothetical protein
LAEAYGLFEGSLTQDTKYVRIVDSTHSTPGPTFAIVSNIEKTKTDQLVYAFIYVDWSDREMQELEPKEVKVKQPNGEMKPMLLNILNFFKDNAKKCNKPTADQEKALKEAVFYVRK